VSENSFIASYREAIPLSTQNQFADFLCILYSVKDVEAKTLMTEKMGDQIETVKKYLPDCASKYAKLFGIDDGIQITEEIEEIIGCITDNDFDNEITVQSIVNASFNEVPAQVIAQARDKQLVSKSKRFIHGTTPLFAKLCKLSTEFMDHYINSVIGERIMPRFWDYMAQFCRICVDNRSDSKYITMVISAMVRKLNKVNIIFNFPSERKQDFVDFLNLIDINDDNLADLTILLSGNVCSEPEVNEINIEIIKRHKPYNRSNIFKEYVDAYQNADQNDLNTHIRKLHQLIEAFPESKNEILDSLCLDDNSFAMWPEESLVYIESFIR
jgi:hypothetical protein